MRAACTDQLRHADEMGILADGLRVDMSRMQTWKTGVVQKLTGGITHLLKTHGVNVVHGAARFTGSHTVEVMESDGRAQTLSAANFLIATGSSPVRLPGLNPDGNRIAESQEALEWREIPDRLCVVGAGVIGLEMGTLYARLGSRVTLIEAGSDLLPEMDLEIVRVLRRSLKKRGMDVRCETQVKAVVVQNGRIEVELVSSTGSDRLEADKLLSSVGRKPDVRALGLENAGVRTNERGFILTDAQLRTSAAHIFAVGDVTGPPLLAHKASKEGLVAAAVIAGGNDRLDYRAMPAAIFCDPEIATVGLTEAQAASRGHRVKTGQFPFAASGRALSMNMTDGFMKVVADAESDAVLGVHMIGPTVSELIAEAALAIEMGATSEDLALTVHTHPTLPEALMEAAEAVHGMAIHGMRQSGKRSG